MLRVVGSEKEDQVVGSEKEDQVESEKEEQVVGLVEPEKGRKKVQQQEAVLLKNLFYQLGAIHNISSVKYLFNKLNQFQQFDNEICALLDVINSLLLHVWGVELLLVTDQIFIYLFTTITSSLVIKEWKYKVITSLKLYAYQFISQKYPIHYQTLNQYYQYGINFSLHKKCCDN